MGDATKTEQEDCPCTRCHNDGTAVVGCPECGGTGTIEVDDLEDDAFDLELAEINAELDYFADDEAA